MSSSGRSSDSTSSRVPQPGTEKPAEGNTRDGVENGVNSKKSFKYSGHWSLLLVLGQLLVLVGGWAFYAVTQRNIVTVSASTAETIKQNPKPTTYLVTLLATIISSVIAILYCRAVVYALSMKLCRPTSLLTLSSSLAIAGRGFIWNIERPLWTLFAALCAISLAVQSAGWATLLTPQLVVVQEPMNGFELDYANEDFQSLASETLTDTWQHIGPLILASGSAAAASSFGLPGIINFNQVSFINSTAGILPISLEVIHSSINANDVIIVNTNLTNGALTVPEGFNTNYTTTQQGFTAEVVCVPLDGEASESPFSIDEEEVIVLNNTYVSVEMSYTCADGKVVNSSRSSCHDEYMVSQMPPKVKSLVQSFTGEEVPVTYLKAAVCVNEETEDYDLVLHGAGIYSFLAMVVCNVKTMSTVVDANYYRTSGIFSSGSSPHFVDVLDPIATANVFPGGQGALFMLERAIVNGEASNMNGVGNGVSAFPGNGQDIDVPMKFLGEYIRGVIEFAGTLTRATYAEANNSLFPNGESEIPEQMRIVTNGTYIMETMGWDHSTDTNAAILLAPTLLTFVTMMVIIYTKFRTVGGPGFEKAKGHSLFDVTDIVHVILASAAGGMETSEVPAFYDQKVLSTKVSLRAVEDKLGFVQGAQDSKTSAQESAA